MKKFIGFIILISALTLPSVSSALELTYPTFNGVTLDSLMDDPQGLSKLILWLYYLMVSISGLAAFAMIVWGGVQWMTSTGSPTKTSEAKDKIQSALFGLLLILSSYIILRLINPDLLILSQPLLPT